MDVRSVHFQSVRIKYDNKANEYLYEVIEPRLLEDEKDVLELLKQTLVASVEHMTEAAPDEKEKYLRRIVERMMAQPGSSLTPISKEKVMYYVVRAFLGYGVVNVMMNDPNVEDCSCDGVKVPIYIYHRKYGSIRSSLKFDTDLELDGLVVGLAP